MILILTIKGVENISQNTLQVCAPASMCSRKYVLPQVCAPTSMCSRKYALPQVCAPAHTKNVAMQLCLQLCLVRELARQGFVTL